MNTTSEADLLQHFTEEGVRQHAKLSEGVIGSIVGFGLFLIESKARMPDPMWKQYTDTGR
jgi:hypothetical protein